MVPKGGSLPYAIIADRVGMSEQVIKRLLRHAMTMRIFHEPAPGLVAHTKASAMLADPMMSDWLQVGTHEMWPAAVKMLEALKTWPDGSSPHETGFCLANNTTESLYQVLGKDIERAARFSNAMKVFATSPEYSPVHIINSFNWGSLGKVLVLDVGGAHGHVAFELAKSFENLSIIVQDMPDVIQEARAPSDLQVRVTFEDHDIFAEQGAKADVLLLRWVLHNWSDANCIRILRAQIPALMTHSKLIIQDTCMPSPGTIALWKERELRAFDIDMAATFNAREREIGEWNSLFESADPRFELEQVTTPPGSALSTMIVGWHDHEAL